jgi:hypothetical protein
LDRLHRTEADLGTVLDRQHARGRLAFEVLRWKLALGEQLSESHRIVERLKCQPAWLRLCCDFRCHVPVLSLLKMPRSASCLTGLPFLGHPGSTGLHVLFVRPLLQFGAVI